MTTAKTPALALTSASTNDVDFLAAAYQEAEKCLPLKEVPVGAVVVMEGRIIAKAHNLMECSHDATSHAEILAIRKATAIVGDWRLNNATLYCTLEPCPMCAGAIIQARIKRVVYSTLDYKWGAHQSKVNLFQEKLFNHNVQVDYIPEEKSGLLLTSFFRQKRLAKK